MKQTLIWFNLQRDGTRNGLSNIKETCRKFAATNVSSAPMYEHFPVFNAGLSSSYDGWAKCKEKVPDVRSQSKC